MCLCLPSNLTHFRLSQANTSAQNAGRVGVRFSVQRQKSENKNYASATLFCCPFKNGCFVSCSS